VELQVIKEAVAKPLKPVTPAKAGVQKLLKNLDSRLRGNDVCGLDASSATASKMRPIDLGSASTGLSTTKGRNTMRKTILLLAVAGLMLIASTGRAWTLSEADTDTWLGLDAARSLTVGNN
jgi:hypothetical protein